MLRNYLLIVLRTFWKNKVFSLINILGLALGMACSIMILLWIHDEMNYDKFHKNLPRLHRVMENQSYSEGKTYTFSATPGPLKPAIVEDFPEIEMASRMSWPSGMLINYEDASFYKSGRWVDPEFIEMFTLNFISGETSSALDETRSIVISASMAQAFFGEQDPLGKMLQVNNDQLYAVSAVFEDIPATSTYDFDFLLNIQTWLDENPWSKQWGNNGIRTFVLLNEQADHQEVTAKIHDYVKKHNEGSIVELFLQPVSEVRLYSEFKDGKNAGGRIVYIRIFAIVALFILLIACINFMNLSTAQSSRRAKEVGLRKSVGAGRAQLIGQFFNESIILSFISIIVALGIVVLIMPLFNQLTHKELSILSLDRSFWIWIFGIALLTGLVSGSYPAMVLSRFNPVVVLKGKVVSGNGAHVFRRGLVVFQFVLSIILIMGTIVVYRQLNFIYTKNIGFEKENIIAVPMNGEMHKATSTIINQLRSSTNFVNSCTSSASPISFGSSTWGVDWDGKQEDERILFSNFSVSPQFIETFNMELVAGRSFDEGLPNDTLNFLINEEAVRRIGFEGDAIGQRLSMGGVGGDAEGKVIGVVKDFHFNSLHAQIDPLIMYYQPERNHQLFVRTHPQRIDDAVKELETVYRSYAPAYPFEYHFIERDWEDKYKSEQQVAGLFNYFAFLAIFISCLGLYGLAAYTTERRTQEIGIRKAMGASVGTILRLISKEFVILVFVAAVIASPIAWYLLVGWLEHFAYHIDITWITFVISISLSLIIAILSVAFQSIKAALANPVDALRYE